MTGGFLRANLLQMRLLYECISMRFLSTSWIVAKPIPRASCGNFHTSSLLQAMPTVEVPPLSSKRTEGTKRLIRKDPPSGFSDIPISGMKHEMRQTHVTSKETKAFAYSGIEVSVTHLKNLRKKMANCGFKASINDFTLKAVANALCKCPAINIRWEGSELKRNKSIDISIAVATKGGATAAPTITDIAEKSVISISNEAKTLVEKYRLREELSVAEFMGGTMVVTNLGMFGIHHWESLILFHHCSAVSVGESILSLCEDGTLRETSIVSMSYDAACISEEDAAKFLTTVKYEIENIHEFFSKE